MRPVGNAGTSQEKCPPFVRTGPTCMAIRPRASPSHTPQPGSPPKPQIASPTPGPTTAGDAGFTLTVNGSGFLPGAKVTWDRAINGFSGPKEARLAG